MPFFEKFLPVQPGMRQLEIGCAEAGGLKAFTEKGCITVGVELDEPRLVLTRGFMQKKPGQGLIDFVSKDSYKVVIDRKLKGKFNLVTFKDVIEQIHNQEKLIAWLKSFLLPGGANFFAEIKEKGISSERFEHIVRKAGYAVVNKTHYFINPIFMYKFGWKPKLQLGIISRIHWMRIFLLPVFTISLHLQKNRIYF